LDQLSRWLRALPDTAARTERRLADLHTLAFDRHVGERNGRGGTPPAELEPLVGSPQARDLWHRAAKATHTCLVELEAVSHAIGHLLNAGDPADNTLRGTMLGDEDQSASEELNRLVANQTQRSARGDYVPNREMAQPKVPRR
jgi:hypothetical protein